MKRVFLLIISILSLSSVTNAQEGEKSLKLWHRFHLDIGLGGNYDQTDPLTSSQTYQREWVSIRSSLGFRAKYFNLECSFDRPAYKILYPHKLWRELAMSGSINIAPIFNRGKEGKIFLGPLATYGKTSGFYNNDPTGKLIFPTFFSGGGITVAYKIKDEHRLVLTYCRTKFVEEVVRDYDGAIFRDFHTKNTLTASFSFSSAIFKKKQKKKEQP